MAIYLALLDENPADRKQAERLLYRESSYRASLNDALYFETYGNETAFFPFMEKYDLIFIDAAKAQYINYLPVCKKMLCDGGLLVSDNVLFDGDIVLSRFAVRRRDRTIHARMREYLRAVSEDEELVTTILPVGDGMTVSVKTRGGSAQNDQA